MAQFCRFCGAPFKKPDARYCSVCGKPVESSDGRSVAQPVEAPQCLTIRVAGQAPYSYPLSRSPLLVGRASDNDIVLPLQYVSSHHGRLDLANGEWCYTDLGSTNGTYINGRKGRTAVLKHGDVLRVGDPNGNSVGLTYRCGPEAEVFPASGTIALAAKDLQGAAHILIGRDPSATIHLPAPAVSWSHARIDATPQGRMLIDLNSTNGTFVNGHRIAGSQMLRESDVIQIGPFKLVFELAGVQQYAVTGGVRLDGLQVTREVGQGSHIKRILNDVSLTVYPREFIALVGTSGAGKSTLMKALSGVERADRGQVLLNGDSLYDHFDVYRTLIGYVPQDDILHRGLKVVDALRYSAKLRLPPDTTDEEITKRIEEVLEDVEMVAQKDQVINSLSGGQRKRVSIASELLAAPRLFFLDEPTSGLDPGLEKKMMYTLRRLADQGRTIVLVTHATANITQCDQVCFMAHGRMTYYGPPEETFGFFGVTTGDFSDVYDKLDSGDPKASREQAASWEQKYRQSSQHQQFVADRQRVLPSPDRAQGGAQARRGPKVDPLRQLVVLTQRYFNLVLRDKLLLTVLMVIMPIIGALVVLVSNSNWLVGDPVSMIDQRLASAIAAGEASSTYSVTYESQTLLFIMAFASVLLGLFASVYEIVKEWSIYQRERMVTLRIIPYITSKVLVMGVFALFQCLLFLIVIGLKVDYPKHGALLSGPLEMYVTLFLGALAAIMMGLLISALVPNSNTVIYVVFLVLMFQMIFAGVLFNLPGLSKQASNFTLTRWSMEALGASTDLESLNTTARTRFQPDPVTETVSTEVEKPSDDWEPVTVITKTQEISVPIQPGVFQTVPISVPEVTVNEMVTVLETVTETFTVEPDTMDVYSEIDFQISYARTAGHLLRTWIILLAFGFLFALATAFVLKRKDVI